jgi:predicted alpha/beta hydrolase family esterase
MQDQAVVRHATILLLPGLQDSGPLHWQTLWMKDRPWMRRVEQRDWETPRLADWVENLEAAVRGAEGPVLLVAHSAACALVAHWAAASPRAIRGALLVAPPDVEAPSFPPGTTGFAPMPLAPLPFPSTVVASSDDPYVSPARARRFALAWGSRLVEIGTAGHINTASGHGLWPLGLELLRELKAAAWPAAVAPPR